MKKFQIQTQMKNSIYIVVFLSYFLGFSQIGKGELKKIDKDGFYKIFINPEVSSLLNDNLNYFRIIDANKNEVPFVIFDKEKRKSFYFKKFNNVIKNEIKDSVSSYIIPIHSYNMKYCKELSFLISNSTIDKSYNISGSYDMKEWFGISMNQTLSDLENQNGAFVEKIISFPFNNYKYLKIDFNDKKSLPINVVDIGFIRNEKSVLQYQTLNGIKVKTIEDKKNKKSLIEISSKTNQRINAVEFNILSSQYYRNARIYSIEEVKTKRGSVKLENELLNFKLSSNTENNFKISPFYGKQIFVEILNYDDQPLKIKNVKLYQESIAVVAKLKANEKYSVIVDTTLSKPQYDLVNFTDSLTYNLPIAYIDKIKINNEIKDKSKTSFIETKAFIWLVLSAIGLLLLYVTVGFLKEINKK